MIALAVFLAVAIGDICWAKYIAYAAHGHRLPAAAWSAALFLCGAFTVVEYTRNHWLLIPAALGAFAGTVVGVKETHA